MLASTERLPGVRGDQGPGRIAARVGGDHILDPAVCVRPFTLDHQTALQVISRTKTRLDLLVYVQHYVSIVVPGGDPGIRFWLSYVYIPHDLRAKWLPLVRKVTGVPRPTARW